VGGIAGSVGNVQGTPTAVERTGTNSFTAFSMRCPHQGTTIRIENWKSTGSAFHCPNHDALFDAAGKLLAGSPQSTGNLVVRTVTYAAGDTTLYVT
jgi:Rieske Fe-S protein